MKVHVVPKSSGGIAEQVAMQPIRAVDLTTRPEYRPLWRSPAPNEVPPIGLPSTGTASPMGFWLAGVADAGPPVAEGPRITFVPPGDAASAPEPTPAGRRGRPAQTVKLKSPNAGDGDLLLTIGPAGAQVAASEAAWKTLAEPVLLAVCQYWRFLAVDAEIDRLTELAKGDLGHATMPGPASIRDRGRLAANAQDVRTLLLDLPHFQGPLTDPSTYCASERAAQAYRTLSEKLRLEEWCELIDERAEAIEDTYEAVTEKLFEYKNFAWEAVLEVLIIVILLAELAVQAWEAFGPD